MELADLGLPRRVLTILEANGVTTAEGLLDLNERELLSFPKLGPGALREILEALAPRGLLLNVDPWAPYECARHGQAQWDVTLASFFLCDECADEFQRVPFGGAEPLFGSSAMAGYCSHCNLERDLRLRQWLLCSWCERVLRSIGRSVASARFVTEVWAEHVQPAVPSVVLEEIDAARLLRRDKETMAAKVASADFKGIDAETGELLFEIELKTGKSRIAGETIGTKMGTFQLDQSDCDDILAVVERDRVPVYLAHAQVVDRVEPPTVRFAPVAMWWTDLFTMRDHFIKSDMRPREAKIAAYYDVHMFWGVPELIEHLNTDGPRRLKDRLENEGIPALYELPAGRN